MLLLLLLLLMTMMMMMMMMMLIILELIKAPHLKNFFRVATHAADNNQIRTRDPRLKPSAADAAHIW